MIASYLTFAMLVMIAEAATAPPMLSGFAADGFLSPYRTTILSHEDGHTARRCQTRLRPQPSSILSIDDKIGAYFNVRP